MTTDALTLPFRTIVFVILLTLLLTRETTEQVIGVSWRWLWLAVACNISVMLIHFIHPTISLFTFAVLAVSALYLLLVPILRWRHTYPNIVGLGVLLMVVQWRLGREVHIAFFHLSIEVWLAFGLAFAIVLGLRRLNRLLCVNSIFFANAALQVLLKQTPPDAGYWAADHVLFSEYWLSILLVTVVNLSEVLLGMKRTRAQRTFVTRKRPPL